jgi:hypothetical protein
LRAAPRARHHRAAPAFEIARMPYRPMTVSTLFALACLAAAAPAAHAATATKPAMLYKCVAASGVTSIQSSPCPAGSTTEWKRDTAREAPPTPEQAAQAEARRLRNQQEVRELSAQVERRLKAQDAATVEAAPVAEEAAEPVVEPVAPSINPDLQACQDAQAFANDVREKAWLGLSDEQVRRLFQWVAQQCKVPAAG